MATSNRFTNSGHHHFLGRIEIRWAPIFWSIRSTPLHVLVVLADQVSMFLYVSDQLCLQHLDKQSTDSMGSTGWQCDANRVQNCCRSHLWRDSKNSIVDRRNTDCMLGSTSSLPDGTTTVLSRWHQTVMAWNPSDRFNAGLRLKAKWSMYHNHTWSASTTRTWPGYSRTDGPEYRCLPYFDPVKKVVVAAVRIPIGCRHAERMADLSTYGGQESSANGSAGVPTQCMQCVLQEVYTWPHGYRETNGAPEASESACTSRSTHGWQSLLLRR